MTNRFHFCQRPYPVEIRLGLGEQGAGLCHATICFDDFGFEGCRVDGVEQLIFRDRAAFQKLDTLKEALDTCPDRNVCGAAGLTDQVERDVRTLLHCLDDLDLQRRRRREFGRATGDKSHRCKSETGTPEHQKPVQASSRRPKMQLTHVVNPL